jgi:iduronate 2-sulfatase
MKHRTFPSKQMSNAFRVNSCMNAITPSPAMLQASLAPLQTLAFGLGCVLTMASAHAASATAREARPPNILFIAADDLRNDLGCYGSTVLTPNLDRLAARGRVFNRAYCQQAVCNPSRASVMTGLRPDTLKVWDLSTRFRETTPGVVTLPEHFKRHGYFTQGIGKIFHNETRQLPNRVSMTDPASWSVPPTYAQGAHWQDWVVPGDPAGPKEKSEAWQALDVPDDAYFDGQIAAEACAALEHFGRSQTPFLLAVGFWKPHLPFNAPKQYWDLYDRAAFGAPEEEFPKDAPVIARHHWSELRSYRGMPAEGPLTADEASTLRHGYAASISFMDAQVGRLMDQLERSGLADNTIVVFWSDHGFHLGEQALWAKTSNYELDARVPLIIAGPGVEEKGAATEALVELIDLFPTLVEMAGLPAISELEGQSLRPLLRDPRLPGKLAALSQHPQPFYGQPWTAMGYTLRTERFRYVEWRERSTGAISARELYDHVLDPREACNVVDAPAYAGAVAQLQQLARQSYTFVPSSER